MSRPDHESSPCDAGPVGMRLLQRPDVVVRRGTLVGFLTATVLLLSLVGVQRASATVVGGSHWTVEQVPNVPSSQLSAISCTSTTACMAVGQSGQVGLAERWNGFGWSQVPVPSSAGPLHGISCTSANACMAVGSNRCGGPVADRWNGSRWQDSPLRLSATIKQCASVLQGVSCASRRFCLAAGNPNALERWNGRRWFITSVPRVSNAQLFAVSCAAPNACAVGGGWGDTGNGGRLLEFWNGRHWSGALRNDNNSRVATTVNGVSCPSRAACIAVAGNGDNFPYADSWNGRSWSNITTPNDYQGLTVFNAVSCTSPRSCLIVGSVPPGYGDRAVASWNGRVFTPSPNDVTSSFSGLTGVSCVQQTACTVVGTGVSGSPLAARNF